MPKVQSSSKTGTQLVLFAQERRYMRETRDALEWVAEHSDDADLSKLCSDICNDLGEALRLLAAPEKEVAAK